MSNRLRWGACSEIGLVRKVNEDSKLSSPPLFAVADGMGGHASGDVASALAVEVLSTEMSKSDSLSDAVHGANRAIFQKAAKDPDLTGMGTTITAMLAEESSAKIAHVGDSRAYLLRVGQLSRLTQDHTVVNRLVQQGRILPEDADRHPQRSYLERALGIDPDVEVDVHVLDMEPGDRVLLCSDGLFGMIDDDLIQSVMEAESDPQRACERLCEEAVHAGGHDNVTTVIVDFPPRSGRGAGPAGRKQVPTASRHTDTGPIGGTARPALSTAGTAPAPAPPPVRISSSTSSPRRSSRAVRALIWFVVVAVIAGAGTLLARSSIKGSWYVGVADGQVAVFNGVPGSVAGIELSDLESRTTLRSDSLPELYQGRLEEGIKANSLKDAGTIVEDLQKLAGQEEQETAQEPPAEDEERASPGPSQAESSPA